MRFLLLALAIGVVPALGCGDDSGGSDAGPADTGADAFDAGTDSGPPPMSTLFGECVVDEQCPGAGAFCRLPTDGYPLGSCTLPCADRTPCDDGVVFNHCLPDPLGESTQSVCLEKCLNTQDCLREGYACFGIEGAAEGVCLGFCTSDEECGEGAECNEHSGDCLPTGTVPTGLSATGEMCAGNDDCLSGSCLLETSAGAPTGWNGGYCLGACLLPMGYNTNTFFSGDAYPTEQCADAQVCYPVGSLTRGDPGVCVSVCDTDADCREDEGYACDKTVGLSDGSTKTFTNGVCFPINCAERTCPTGYECVGVGSGADRRNVCQRT